MLKDSAPHVRRDIHACTYILNVWFDTLLMLLFPSQKPKWLPQFCSYFFRIVSYCFSFFLGHLFNTCVSRTPQLYLLKPKLQVTLTQAVCKNTPKKSDFIIVTFKSTASTVCHLKVVCSDSVESIG